MTDIELVSRLEILERDNRRLKRLVFATLVLSAALGAIYATRPVPLHTQEHGPWERYARKTDKTVSPVPDVIKAHEFDVLDRQGNVRIRSYVDNIDSAVVDALTSDGNSVVQILASGSGIARSGMVGVQNLEGRVWMGGGGTFGKLPRIMISDSEGFALDLGVTDTVTPATGAKQQTSAASIIMFGNDKEHHVVWQAP